LLKTVCKEQTLLDSTLRRSRGLSDGLNESVANIVSSIASDLVVLGNVHDRLIQFFLDTLVICEAFLADGQLGFDVRVALPRRALELVVLGAQDVKLLLEGLILELRLFDNKQVILIKVLDADRVILLGPHVKLELSKLLITGFLEGAELENQLFVALRLVAEVMLKLRNASLLLILALDHELKLSLVLIGQVLLHMLQFFVLAVLQIVHLAGILLLKLRLDVVVGGQDAIHVLLSLLLGLKQAHLGAVHFIFESCYLVL